MVSRVGGGAENVLYDCAGPYQAFLLGQYMDNMRLPDPTSRTQLSTDYVLIIGEHESATALQQLLWENGLLSYVPKLQLPFDVILARRGQPTLILAYLEQLETDMLIQIEELRLYKDIPLLCLVSPGQVEPRILAMLHMATDFIRIPVEPYELLLRIQRLSRGIPGHSPVHRPPARRINANGMHPGRQRAPKRLSPVEVQILSILQENVGDTVDFETLSQCVEGDSLEQRINTLRVHVLRLRRKLEPNPKQPQYILNERSVGYRLAKPIENDAVPGVA